MVKRWQVRIVDDLDDSILGAASEFLHSFMPAGTEAIWSADYFKWKLGDSNPAGRGFMTVAIHDGAIVGVTSVTRKRFWSVDSEIAVAEIGDTYSHPDYRRDSHASEPHSTTSDMDAYVNRSIFGRLVTETRARAEESGISLIYGTPNENSMPGYVSHLGFFHYDTHRNQYFVRPGAKGLVQQIPVLRPFQGLLRVVERSHASLLRRIASRSLGLNIQEATEIGPEIESLWERLRPERSFGTLRDQAYFRHRFIEHPLANYRLWNVMREAHLCGVFVTTYQTDSNALVTHYLADWLLDPGIKRIFPFVVSNWIAQHGGPTTKSFSFWGEREWTKSQGTLKLGCIGKNLIPIIFFDDANSRSLQNSDPVLDFTLATSDNI